MVIYDTGVETGKKLITDRIIDGKNLMQITTSLTGYLAENTGVTFKDVFVSDSNIKIISESCDIGDSEPLLPVIFLKGLFYGVLHEYTGKNIIINIEKKQTSYLFDIHILNTYHTLFNQLSITKFEDNQHMILELFLLSILSSDPDIIEKVHEAGKIFAKQVYFSSDKTIETDIKHLYDKTIPKLEGIAAML